MLVAPVPGIDTESYRLYVGAYLCEHVSVDKLNSVGLVIGNFTNANSCVSTVSAAVVDAFASIVYEQPVGVVCDEASSGGRYVARQRGIALVDEDTRDSDNKEEVLYDLGETEEIGRARGIASLDTQSVAVCAAACSEVDTELVNGKGKHYERNKLNREKKKQRKKKKQAMSGNWRDTGYFSKCDDEIKKKLRDTRAELLVAKNLREKAEEEKKLKVIQSVPEVVGNLLAVTRTVNQLCKQTKDNKISKWASAVSDSITKSIAESAPSSVPSLESVGYGDSALDSSNVKSERVQQYNVIKAGLEKQFESQEVVDTQYYATVMEELNEMYSDVVLDDVEYIKKQQNNKFEALLCKSGIGFEKIEDIMSKID